MGIIRTAFSEGIAPAANLVAAPLAGQAAQPAALSVNQNQLQNEIETRARAIANEIVAQTARQRQTAANGRVFTRFDVATDVIENQKTFISKCLAWMAWNY